MIPVAFVMPPVACSTFTAFNNLFNDKYPTVPPDTKLYRVLYTNFINSSLGYSLTYEDYVNFTASCTSNTAALLFNQAEAQSIIPDDLACASSLVINAVNAAGSEYERYVEIERLKFRNNYVSACLSNKASSRLEGAQKEYHYTLYYYDQSGNLVKTIPPEGVKILNDQELELLETYRDETPGNVPVQVFQLQKIVLRHLIV